MLTINSEWKFNLLNLILSVVLYLNKILETLSCKLDQVEMDLYLHGEDYYYANHCPNTWQDMVDAFQMEIDPEEYREMLRQDDLDCPF